MNRIPTLLGMAIGLVMLLGSTSSPVAAQDSVSASDIQRLQDSVSQAGREIAGLRARDAQLADQLQGELDNLREEAIYLKVKQRREGTVARTEYLDLRDKIDRLSDRARGNTPAAAPAAPATPATKPADTVGYEVPVGTELDVRLQTALSSRTAQAEDRFEATTVVALTRGDHTLIPAGSVVRGIVTSVDRATRTDRKGQLTLSLDQITVSGHAYAIRATVTDALESEGIRGEAGRIGVGAGVGAILGGILGGAKGAIVGILIGGGGTIAATAGTDVELQPGTVLRLRFDSALIL